MSDAPIHLSPGRKAWRRFKQNRPAMISLWFLILLLIVVISWPIILKFADQSDASYSASSTSSTNASTVAAKKIDAQVQIFPIYDPDTLSDSSFTPPGARHWCGTDV